MAGTVNVTLTAEDYVAANREWLLRYLGRRRTIGRAVVTMLGIGSAVGVALMVMGDTPRAALALGAIATGAGFGALVLGHALSYLILPRRTRRLFEQSISLQKPYEYSWSETGIGFRSDSDSGHRPWHELYGWAEGRSVFLFFLNEQLFYTLPRRTLTDAEAADLRATAEASGIRRR